MIDSVRTMMPPKEFSPWGNYWQKKTAVETEGRGVFNVYSTEVDSPFVVFCIHGAGHSGLSFSLLSLRLIKHVGVIAPDLKCHGDTPGDPTTDFVLESMVEDALAIIKATVPEDKSLIIVGHSLGAVIATKISYLRKTRAVINIDAVEGVAKEGLRQMVRVLRRRPPFFDDVTHAIGYASNAGEIQNAESAAISTAGRLKLDEGGRYVWRTDLMSCSDQWGKWFEGFGEEFNKLPGYRVLIVTTIDKLDTPFTIGHMTGKFQLEVIPNTCHCIHEDNPEAIVKILVRLMKRIGPG